MKLAQDREIWISSSHIPGVENTIAEKISSMTTQNECCPTCCLKFCVKSFSLAHRLMCLPPGSINRQTDKYVSWMPDQHFIAVNSFNFSLKTHKIYAFPPFSLVAAATPVIRDKTIRIMIIPKWTAQCWFPPSYLKLYERYL